MAGDNDDDNDDDDDDDHFTKQGDGTCTCVTCRQRYTRAYLHHLLRSKEMLAEILLYHHNHHQLQLLFHTARNHRSNQSFDDWVGHAFH